MLSLPMRNYILLLSVLFTAYSCKPGIPRDIMSESEMEDILYDYHLAKGLAQQKPSDSLSYYMRYYQQKVFEKYNINEAEFDSNMVWYSRHTERLSNIYTHLAERVGNNQHSVSGPKFLSSGESSANGDTLNFWPASTIAMLHSQSSNYSLFKVKNDTIVHPGDYITWRFKTDWYYNDGVKQAIAMLTTRFKNDSVAFTTRYLYGTSGLTEVTMYTGNDTIKEIEGFIYQQSAWTKQPRIVSVSDIQLLRIKQKTTVTPANEASEAKPLMSTSTLLP